MKNQNIKNEFLAIAGGGFAVLAAGAFVVCAALTHDHESHDTPLEGDIIASEDICTTDLTTGGRFSPANLCGDPHGLYAGQSPCYGAYAYQVLSYAQNAAAPFLETQDREIIEAKLQALGPSEIKFDEDDNALRAVWKNEAGQLHNINGPAIITVDLDDRSYLDLWMKDGEFNRADNLPTFTKYVHGAKARLQWESEAGPHNEYGPAFAEISIDAQEMSLGWSLNGSPANTDYDHGFTFAKINLANNIAFFREAASIIDVDLRRRHQNDNLHVIRLDRETGIELSITYTYHDHQANHDQYQKTVSTDPLTGQKTIAWTLNDIEIPEPENLDFIMRPKAHGNNDHPESHNHLRSP